MGGRTNGHVLMVSTLAFAVWPHMRVLFCPSSIGSSIQPLIVLYVRCKNNKINVIVKKGDTCCNSLFLQELLLCSLVNIKECGFMENI